MKIFKIFATGNFADGVAIVASNDIDEAVELANKYIKLHGFSGWRNEFTQSETLNGFPEELTELKYIATEPKVIMLFESGA